MKESGIEKVIFGKENCITEEYDGIFINEAIEKSFRKSCEIFE